MLNSEDIKKAINSIISIINNNFIKEKGKLLSSDEIYDFIQDLDNLMKNYENNVKDNGLIAINKAIPLINLIIKLEKDEEKKAFYYQFLKILYKYGARISLNHYFIYREWDIPDKEKFYAPRYQAIQGYIHFLEEIVLNPNFTDLIFNAPAGFGKTYPEKIAEAWSYGIEPTGAILSLCSNATVVWNGSSLVRQEIKSDWFGEVFPKMKWTIEDKNFFLKETDENWKLRDCKLGASYNASTCNSNVIGQRASKWIHIDDLYKDYREALNKKTNTDYFNDCQLSWRTRYVLNAIPKMVITGTLWASGDFIDLMIKQMMKEHKFYKHPKYPYTYISEDKTCVIIQLPALDYDTGKSVFPKLKSTEELIKIKNRISRYLWETNYQQKPTNPEELVFSYDKLRTYEVIPETDYKGAYSVIDATRKSGKDFFAMPIFKKVKNDDIYDYYLKDCLFTRTATKDMYDDVVNKIIEHHIIKLVIESNVTSELKQAIEERLKKYGYLNCEIIEKYNTEQKSARIENEKHLIKKQLLFPKQEMYGANTDVGKYMENLTSYNETGSNANDDAPDSSALFCSEIIEESSVVQKAEPLTGIREYL